jgi:glycosyltransferase involved in cell wall biosynthesis
MTDIEVYYPTGRNLADWEGSHAMGALPDRWPYGLNKMALHGEVSLRPVEALPLRPIGVARYLLLAGRSGNSSKLHLPAIAWDEDLALRLAAERPYSAKFCGVIWTTDRLVRRDASIKDALLKAVLPRFRGLWVLSRAQIPVLNDWLGGKVPPIEFLRFGIDEQFFSASPYPKEPMILSIGRDRDRDPDTLFEALDEIRRKRPDARIVVQTTSDRPLPPGVTSIQMLPHAELRDLYRQASIVLVATKPNLHVSGMTVALESMATARPVIMSQTPGMEDYVEDGVAGLLYSPGDAEGMARGALKLLDDPIAAASMGLRGRQAIEDRHTTAEMACRIREMVLRPLA